MGQRIAHRLVVVTGLLAAWPAAAAAADNGGTGAPAPPVTTAVVGGTSPAAADSRPIAHITVHIHARRPSIRVRFQERGIRRVVARVVVVRTPGNRIVAKIRLGSVPTGRSLRVRWPKGRRLSAGSYVVLVHAHDRMGHQLHRRAGASGKTRLVVRPRPRPAPPAAPPSAGGVFPVAGWHTYGDLFGAPRKGYSHQGVDVLAGRGTPVVAPLSGTIITVGYQASAAGYYAALNASDGHAYFFAHCQIGSLVVSSGQSVATGGRICNVGSTGDATGPHLHFEEWVGGWRVDAGSHPIDPLPQLKAWDH
jgi:hypothetical protein